MQRRLRAEFVDLDVASLIADARPGEAQAAPRAVAAAPRPQKAKGPDKAVLPKAAGKRGRRDSGRDEMLSEYLSSLGRIALLTPEEERDIAARFRDAEVRVWRVLLGAPVVRQLVCGHAVVREAGPAAACLERLTAPLVDAAIIDAAAEALRRIDDERTLVDEAIAVLAAHAKSTRTTRALAEEARVARRRALDVRNRFVRANLRLVVSVARRFHHYRLPLIDLIQEGNLGLIKSVHRFDHTKGFRFSTYAHWWIRQAIERAIMNKGAQVRLPVHVFDARREVAKATRDLQVQLGREPTLEELAAAMQTPLPKLLEVLRAVPREPCSLDEPVGDEEERTLGEVISDAEALTPVEHVIDVDERRWVRRVLTTLSPMEVDIITRRYGLDTDDDETLEEIGKSYNLSRERVRQIQVQGLKKIQRSAEVRLNAG